MDKRRHVGMVEMLWRYFLALKQQWVALMSGGVSVAIGLWEKLFNTSSTLENLLWIGFIIILWATFQTWKSKCLELEDTTEKLMILEKETGQLKSDRSLLLRNQYWSEFERMEETRSKAARYFLKQYPDKWPAEELLDFFDSRVGQSVREGALKVEHAYDDFYYWIEHYWPASQQLFKSRNDDDVTTWEHFAWLWDELSQFHQRKTLCSNANLIRDAEAIDKFLKEEAGDSTNSVI
jgi:hypothetical protein